MTERTRSAFAMNRPIARNWSPTHIATYVTLAARAQPNVAMLNITWKGKQ
jgi:hypothetical protein